MRDGSRHWSYAWLVKKGLTDMNQVEKWDIFEVEVKGKKDGNPFMDYGIQGTFSGEHESVTVDGFYDGNGNYRVRFMPSYEGTYSYHISGTFSDESTTGSFEALPAVGEHNHGPVRVTDGCFLSYEDGTPHNSIGTTCYAWVSQEEALQEQTLLTLQENVFNKIRFCIYPKSYVYNLKEPITYPYEKGNGEGLDKELMDLAERKKVDFPGMAHPKMQLDFNYYQFSIEHFQRFDKRIRQLRDMGIEADLILMHPYDKWGHNVMKKECCDLYIKYVVARFGAFRNVWWSLSNEYDLIATKSIEDWERYAAIICEKDPYGHLRSIHNCMKFYDYTKPWITHCSMQRIDTYRHVEYTDEYQEKYQKPIVWDEIGYEGNIESGWGNLTPQEMVRRFWETALRGGYAGHGETYLDENDILWWSHGGILKGESQKRLRFLMEIYKETPGRYLKKGAGIFDEVVGIADGETKDSVFTPPCAMEAPHPYEIHYYGFGQPAFRMLYLPEDTEYEVDVIDTWDMTVTPVGRHKGTVKIELPGKQYMAIRLRKVK